MYQDPIKRPLGYLPSNEQYDALTKDQKIELLEKGIQYVFWTLAKKTREWESEAGTADNALNHALAYLIEADHDDEYTGYAREEISDYFTRKGEADGRSFAATKIAVYLREMFPPRLVDIHDFYNKPEMLTDVEKLWLLHQPETRENQDGNDITICTHCRNDNGENLEWPCPTAQIFNAEHMPPEWQEAWKVEQDARNHLNMLQHLEKLTNIASAQAVSGELKAQKDYHRGHSDACKEINKYINEYLEAGNNMLTPHNCHAPIRHKQPPNRPRPHTHHHQLRKEHP